MMPAHVVRVRNINNVAVNYRNINGKRYMKKSPLAPTEITEIHSVKGVNIATLSTEVKYRGRDDLLVVELCEGTNVAAVFTTSKTSSAAVQWSQTQIKANKAIRGFIINSGNANAFTGKVGDEDNQQMAQMAAEVIGCEKQQVLTASTGVIGDKLAIEKILIHKSHVAEKLTEANDVSLIAAAKAIMTTDTFEKVSSIKTTINNQEVTISGIAKGSGMIAPDMATMLSFIFTDANIDKDLLQKMVSQISAQTFNCVTVDSDTSTSDTVLVAATGKAGNVLAKSVESCAQFIAALTALMKDLATQIVKDGEGASKFITINVAGAESDVSAKIVAMAIANSPLVKTAIAGEDANWGRVIMAIGKAGEPAERDLIKVAMGGIIICAEGQAISDYDESKVTAHLKSQNITIDVDLQLGQGKSTVWTCDLTEQYIQINADYRS